MKKILLVSFCYLLVVFALPSAFAQGPRTPVVNSKFILGPQTLAVSGLFFTAPQNVLNYNSAEVDWTLAATTASAPTTCSISFLGGPTSAGAQVPIDDPTSPISCLTGGMVTLTVPASDGTAFVVGDVVGVTETGASGGQLLVTAVTSGAITAVSVLTPGSGYTPTDGLTLTGGTGSGGTINLKVVGGEKTVARLPAWINPSLIIAGGTTNSVALTTTLTNWATSSVNVTQNGGSALASASISSATLAQAIAAPPAHKSTFLYGIFLEKMTATTGTVTVRYGTGTNCGTGTATLYFLGPQTATSLVPLGYYPINVQVPAGQAVCMIDDATTTAAVAVYQ